MRSRAIVLDLDDTLYRERRFALSGYKAVAASVEEQFGIDRDTAFKCMTLSMRRGRRQAAFQDLATRFRLSESDSASWLACYRSHQPCLRLRRSVRESLEALRRTWRIGLLTNGLPSVQAAKVAALGLSDLVDSITYADAFGGKPHASAFLEILSRLGIDAGHAVFAGDDERRDIEGAGRVGMKTVLVDRRGTAWGAAVRADAIVRDVTEVPVVAGRLLGGECEDVH